MILYSRTYGAGTRVADTVSVQLELYVLSSDILCAYGIAVYGRLRATVAWRRSHVFVLATAEYNRHYRIRYSYARIARSAMLSSFSALAIGNYSCNPNVTANRYTVISI